MQLIGSEIAGEVGGEEVCSGPGGQPVSVGNDTAAYRGTLQVPARVEYACGNHTACLKMQGGCSPAERSNGEAAELGLADDGSPISVTLRWPCH